MILRNESLEETVLPSLLNQEQTLDRREMSFRANRSDSSKSLRCAPQR